MLGPERFSEFFEALHGHAPYPWQRRLAARVLAEGRWPQTLDLPTGTGKTAAMDVALFALAVDAGRPPEARVMPRRVLMVVDRRLIVDQAHERAKHLQARLRGASGGVLAEVQEALRRLSGEDEPLEVAILRGGMPRDDHWARTPHRPVLAVSTVDQVGSRLLFRGYGVSDRMKSVHAGLLGNDALILLDEVHLSQPFAQTLDALRRRHLAPGASAMPLRWQVVSLSATPGAEAAGEVFSLDEEDRAQPRLARVLRARKPVRTKVVRVRREGDPAEAVAGEAVAQALELVKGGLPVVGVVLNRVAAARAAWRALQAHPELDSALLTGRMRPFDRDDLLADLLPRVAAGRPRGRVAASAGPQLDLLAPAAPEAPPARPLVLVATQCIEAGADLDFDGLVTECASLDALRQRFGRLNRRGEAPRCEGVVLMRSDQVGGRDPIYGEALAATWAWLSALDAPDFGIDALALPEDEDTLATLRPKPERAPTLMPAHVSAWAQTSPVPAFDPEVSQWLHGPKRGPPELRLVWRADLSPEDIRSRSGLVLDGLRAAPPGTGEAMTLTLPAALAWLTEGPEGELADVEGGEVEETRGPRERELRRPAILWRGEESEPLCDLKRIRPGDTLVVSAQEGGISGGTWDPASKESVSDLGDRVQYVQRGRPTLRLHEALWPEGAQPPKQDEDEPDWELRERVAEWLRGGARCGPAWRDEVVSTLAGQRRPRLVELADGARLLVGERVNSGRTFEASTEDEGSSFTGRAVTLKAHCGHVRDRARAFAEALGLPPALVEDLALAGWLHDLGKADPRFQRMLVGGSEVKLAMQTELLAKSSAPPTDAFARAEAARRSGYPRGMRHELVSLALLRETPELAARAHDLALVEHLVASHHGWCRPFAPMMEDPRPVEVRLTWDGREARASSAHGQGRLDSGSAERFEVLNRQYGPWGLAGLEAILRLADHRASEAEQGEEVG